MMIAKLLRSIRPVNMQITFTVSVFCEGISTSGNLAEPVLSDHHELLKVYGTKTKEVGQADFVAWISGLSLLGGQHSSVTRKAIGGVLGHISLVVFHALEDGLVFWGSGFEEKREVSVPEYSRVLAIFAETSGIRSLFTRL